MLQFHEYSGITTNQPNCTLVKIIQQHKLIQSSSLPPFALKSNLVYLDASNWFFYINGLSIVRVPQDSKKNLQVSALSQPNGFVNLSYSSNAFSLLAYRLTFPTGVRIDLVFHVSHLNELFGVGDNIVTIEPWLLLKIQLLNHMYQGKFSMLKQNICVLNGQMSL